MKAAPRQVTESRRTVGSRFIVVTGLSGSGKSQAIRALEDLGYFCVDIESTADSPIFNRTVPLKDAWAKIEKSQRPR